MSATNTHAFLSLSQGGTLRIPTPPWASVEPFVLQQPFGAEPFLIAKLVQTGIASMDLTLVEDPEGGGYRATVEPSELVTFTEGSAQVLCLGNKQHTFVPIHLYRGELS